MDTEQKQLNYFNILSIDGGGIRGVIPAKVIQMMEQFAWDYATEMNYDFPKYPGREGYFAMKDIFNMIAGTSTGSIISSGLAYPNSSHPGMPAYYGGDILEIYRTKGDDLFLLQKLATKAHAFWFIIIVATFGILGYFIGVKKYDDPELKEAIGGIKKIIQDIKRKRDNNCLEVSDHSCSTKMSELNEKLLYKHDDKISERQKRLLIFNFNNTTNLNEFLVEEQLDMIPIIEKNLLKLEFNMEKNRSKKWVWLFAMLITGFFLSSLLLPASLILDQSMYDRTNLDKIIEDHVGGLNIQDVLADEILIVAFDYLYQQPRFYSKYFAQRNEAIYNVDLSIAVKASSSALLVFEPYVRTNQYQQAEVLIDGGFSAQNPSLYAYQFAKGFLDHENIRVLSIGTGYEPIEPIKSSEVDRIWYKKYVMELLVNVDLFTAESYMDDAIIDDNYLRLQTESYVQMNQYDMKSHRALLKSAEDLYNK